MNSVGGTRYTAGQRQDPRRGLRAVLLEDSHVEAMAFTTLASSEGWDIIWCETGEELLQLLEKDSFDLVLLDWQLPGMTGYEVLLRLRNRFPSQPVLMLTVNGSEVDVVRALHGGANDYVLKPWRPHELLARMHSAIRPAQQSNQLGETTERLFGLTFESVGAAVVLANGDHVRLQRKEFQMALMLFRHQGQVVSRSHLLNAVWRETVDDNDQGTRKVDTVVSRVRQKLKLTSEFGFHLRSEWGVGYRLDVISPPVS